MVHLVAMAAAPFLLVMSVATATNRATFSAGNSVNRIYPVSETTTWKLVEDMEFYQNGFRNLHGTPELRFNMTMTRYAVWKAMVLAWYDGDAPREGGDIHFGESVHWSNQSWDVSTVDIVDDWYFKQERLWDYESESPQLTNGTAAFAQMLWAKSHSFGCGQAASEGPRGGTYTVCYYDPPGAVPGEEKANVARPRNYRSCGGTTTTTTSSTTTASGASLEPAGGIF